MVDFSGFSMPVIYTSIKDEALSVRKKSGVFDVSHMGEFFVKGKDSLKFLNFLLPNQMDVNIGKAVYSTMLNESGMILDDLIVYRLGQEEFLLCVNAGNIDKDWNWITGKISDFDCQIFNRSNEFSLLALQGPESEKELLKVLNIQDIKNLAPFEVLQTNELIIARTGYTGEDGFEIFGNHEAISKMWDNFIANGVIPCGLGARDVLRLEVCYPLYGQDLSENWGPLDAGLKWTVKLEKDFIGKSKLSEIPNKKLIKLTLPKAIARTGHKIVNMDQQKEIGEITSGTMSPLLAKSIALGIVDSKEFSEAKKLGIEIRGKIFEAQLVSKPFYQREK
jgi:aminomethyltransferase